MRDNRIDNIKGILIFLVVLGHMLEFCNAGSNGLMLQLIIYTFHMPAFFFFMGMVSKPNPKGVAKNIIIYLLFQVIYYVFIVNVTKEDADLSIVEPYWILWFTMVSVYYGILLIIIDKYHININYLFAISIIASLLIGYASNVGYKYAISRFFTFLPYLLAGIIYKDSKWRYRRSIGIVFLTVILILIPIFYGYYNIHILFGAYSYIDANYNPLIKGSLYIVAFVYILFLYMYVPNKELPIFNKIGKNTLLIYLLHGFFIRLFRKYNFFTYSENVNLILSIMIAFFLVIILGNIRIPKQKET